ncbi:MAG: GTPase Era [Rickettsiales bacterium]|jgi:GTP-binding protein Era|nr:GTPase Era [Rickettsiales bacterium]
MATKSGFVAIIGPTNAGKSTLMNAIMGRKVSIVSRKVQTTRTRLRAVKMFNGVQLIFVDTPGIFNPSRRLDKAMVKSATDSINEADAVLVLVDAKHGITETTRNLAQIAGRVRNVYAVVNKVDAVKKESLLPLARELGDMGIFKEIFMASALKKQGLNSMFSTLAAVMPESPYLFDPQDSVEVPDKLWLAEMTREKIYKFVHQELPYQIHVSTDKVDTDFDGVLEIAQTIYVKTDGHKKIVIGKNGAQLKKIGTAARHEIQDEWGVNARLKLFVRVEDWEINAEHYAEQGLEYIK